VNESIETEIRFKAQAAVISADELSLLESILPDLFHAMIQAEEIYEED